MDRKLELWHVPLAQQNAARALGVSLQRAMAAASERDLAPDAKPGGPIISSYNPPRLRTYSNWSR